MPCIDVEEIRLLQVKSPGVDEGTEEHGELLRQRLGYVAQSSLLIDLDSSLLDAAQPTWQTEEFNCELDQWSTFLVPCKQKPGLGGPSQSLGLARRELALEFRAFPFSSQIRRHCTDNGQNLQTKLFLGNHAPATVIAAKRMARGP